MLKTMSAEPQRVSILALDLSAIRVLHRFQQMAKIIVVLPLRPGWVLGGLFLALLLAVLTEDRDHAVARFLSLRTFDVFVNRRLVFYRFWFVFGAGIEAEAKAAKGTLGFEFGSRRFQNR